MTPHVFVQNFVTLMELGKRMALGDYPTPYRKAPTAGTAVLFSPHPDDEILGAGPLAVKLRSEGFRILNVAMTLGSNPAHIERRRNELEAACAHLGFTNVLLEKDGFGAINPEGIDMEQLRAIITIQKYLEEQDPDIIIAPHECDLHPRHIATAYMVRTAIQRAKWSGLLFETEYWFQMEEPNMVLEVSPERLAVMMEALTYHKGELARNPYHLRWPGRLADNVGRAEVVLGTGAAPPDWNFAALYRRSVCTDGGIERTKPDRQLISAEDTLQPSMWR